MASETNSNNLCKICARDDPQNPGRGKVDWISCDDCEAWFHFVCLGYSKKWLRELGDTPYYCAPCLAKRVAEEPEDNLLEQIDQENPEEQVAREGTGTSEPLIERDYNSQEVIAANIEVGLLGGLATTANTAHYRSA